MGLTMLGYREAEEVLSREARTQFLAARRFLFSSSRWQSEICLCSTWTSPTYTLPQMNNEHLKATPSQQASCSLRLHGKQTDMQTHRRQAPLLLAVAFTHLANSGNTALGVQFVKPNMPVSTR